MKRFIRKKKRMFAPQKVSRQHISPFIKTVMYVFLFVIIPALFLGLCLNFFTFRKLFMQGILFLIFLLAKGYVFLSCLKLTNKWYLISDVFFIALFAGLYHFVEKNDIQFILLFLVVYTTCIHSFFMIQDIIHKGFASLNEKVLNPKRLFQRRMMDLIDIIKPIVKYSKNQLYDNLNRKHDVKKNDNHDINIDLITNRFFNSIDNKEFPVTSNEISKIYKDLNINIFKQRRYNNSEFLNILIALNLVRSVSEYNNLKRHKCSALKEYSLGGNLKKLLQVIAVLKEIDCPSTCARDMSDYWITTESSLN